MADEVAVMADGRIVEIGASDVLKRSGGAFARLWSSWQTQRGPSSEGDRHGDRTDFPLNARSQRPADQNPR